MENSIVEIIRSIYSYNLFVNKTEDNYAYTNSWLNMEILNALALSDWESSGRPVEWEKWDYVYKEDAKILIRTFLIENNKCLPF